MTAKLIESNIELAMLVYSEGAGRDILRELHYWASVRLRTLSGSKLAISLLTVVLQGAIFSERSLGKCVEP